MASWRSWPFCFCCRRLRSSRSSTAAQHAAHVVPSIPQALLERSVPIRTGIGEAHDDAGTKSREAQAFYDQGLAYLHSFVWIEAARSFHQALEHDPNLALAHVGLSYAYIELSKPAQAKQAIDERAGAGAESRRSRAAAHRGARAADGRGGCAARSVAAGGVSQGARRGDRRVSRRRRIVAETRHRRIARPRGSRPGLGPRVRAVL